MKTLCRSLAVVALALLVAPAARAADVPNINKRGSDEKAFVQELTNSIISNARTSIKTGEVDKYEIKKPKDGRTEIHIKAKIKGKVTGQNATADIVVHIDSSDKDKWEVLRIEYDDTIKGVAKPNRKNLEKLVGTLNGK